MRFSLLTQQIPSHVNLVVPHPGMYQAVFNPRRACAARVTVLGSVCVCVCLLSHISLHEWAIELYTNMHTWWHMNVKKFVGICLKRLRSRDMPRNTSEKANMLIYRLTRGQPSPLNTFDAQENVRGYPGIVNDIQPCPKRCLLMPLVRVGVRTDSTTRYSYNARRGQFPRTRIGICAVCAEGLHFSAFHCIGSHCVIVSLSGKLRNWHLPVPVRPLSYGDFTFKSF